MNQRFIIVGFDALRPELATAAHAPNLARLAQEGVRLQNARSVFPSETKVAMASIATGCYPTRHGIVANGYYEPATGDGRLFDTGNVAQLGRVTETNHGALVTAPTLAGALAAAGKSYLTVSSGTAGNARFLNPRARDLGLVAYSVQGADASSPAADFDGMAARFGPPPAQAVPNVPRCQYAAKLFLEHFLPSHAPDVAVLWLSEPDIAFHYKGVGSPESLEALAAMDAILGDVLAWRDAQPDRDAINIVALSDHGQAAVKGRIEILAAMQQAGFRADNVWRPDVDYVVLARSSGNIWARDDDPGLIRAMADWLTAQDWLGMLFAKSPEAAPGALPLSLARNDHPRAPALFFLLHTDDETSRFGLAGRTFIGADPTLDEALRPMDLTAAERQALATACVSTPPPGTIAATSIRSNTRPMRSRRTVRWISSRSMNAGWTRRDPRPCPFDQKIRERSGRTCQLRNPGATQATHVASYPLEMNGPCTTTATRPRYR